MLPIATTTVTVRRPAGAEDPYVTAADAPVHSSGTPAHIGQPSGSEVDQGGQLEQITDVLLAEAGLDLTHTDQVEDERTGQRYRVAWVRARQGLGLDHVKAGLVTFQGAAAGG